MLTIALDPDFRSEKGIGFVDLVYPDLQGSFDCFVARGFERWQVMFVGCFEGLIDNADTESGHDGSANR